MSNMMILKVDRHSVERGDTSIVEQSLTNIGVLVGEHLAAFQGKFSIALDGYNFDPREVYQIPEARRWWQLLDKQLPHLLPYRRHGIA